MKIQLVAAALTIVNLAILTLAFTQLRPVHSQNLQKQHEVAVLRGRALEIVDSLGKVRASISILPPVEVNGTKYPETVLLRLIDSKGKPVVKLGAAENGAGLTLTDSSDEGVLINVRLDSSFMKITNKGKERIFKP